jgi:Uma2 family endonuclease
MGWLIDPDEQTLFIYFPDRPTAVFEQPTAQLSMPSFVREFQLTLGDLFSWLLD